MKAPDERNEITMAIAQLVSNEWHFRNDANETATIRSTIFCKSEVSSVVLSGLNAAGGGIKPEEA
jgi:hypothetical protein